MLVSRDIVYKFKHGDNNAFGEIYKAYYRLVYYLVLSILKDKYSSEDITQKVFAKAYENINSLKNDNSFHSYLLSIARNESLNELKRRKDVCIDDIDTVSSSNDSYQLRIEDLCEYLSKEETLVATYKIVYEFSLSEIAKYINISVTSTHRIYKQALKKIKKRYDEEQQ